MIDPLETLRDAPDDQVCGVCWAPLPATRYMHVDAWSTAVLCSLGCYRGVVRERRRERWAARRRSVGRLAALVIVTGVFLTPHQGPAARRRVARAAPAPQAPGGRAPALPPGWFGPEWPPTDESFLAALGQDAWIHPLSGPVRRMPRVDSRVFGAERPGQRPAECRNGHCGVDLGGEIWGEHVHAVHDGVVDFVQRNANPDRGGEFVRIAHRDGTVFTQYFHLAAIPPGLERGAHVKSGDVIGLLGDTGVKESTPHLHFALSIRPFKDSGPERYVDPEPLIALWPVRIPIDGGATGLVTTLARPGLPLGSATLSAAHRRKVASLAKAKRGAPPGTDSADGEDGAGDAKPAPEPESETGAPSGDE